MSEHLERQLIRHEGLRLFPYQCPAGFLTIGVGRNLEGKGITKAEALFLLKNDIADAREDVDFLLNRFGIEKYRLNEPRLDALANVAFNIGRHRLSGFKRMFGAAKRGDFVNMAVELLDSKYARDVGGRAVELADQLAHGIYQRG